VRKIIWTMSVSVDGYMEGPNREIDWHMVDDELFRHLSGWLAHAGGSLEGRVTYDLIDEYRLYVHPMVIGGARRCSGLRTRGSPCG